MNDYEGAERRTDPRLTDDDIEWLHNYRAREKAMGALAKRARDFFTFIIILGGAYTLLWDSFKSMVGLAK